MTYYFFRGEHILSDVGWDLFLYVVYTGPLSGDFVTAKVAAIFYDKDEASRYCIAKRVTDKAATTPPKPTPKISLAAPREVPLAQKTLDLIEVMLESPHYAFARQTLEGVYNTISETGRVTERQVEAVGNIYSSKL